MSFTLVVRLYSLILYRLMLIVFYEIAIATQLFIIVSPNSTTITTLTNSTIVTISINSTIATTSTSPTTTTTSTSSITTIGSAR